jgi:cytochrome c peroxidase
VDCHSGDFFTDEEFHVLAIPQIGFGKQLNGDDRGRYLRTGVVDDRYAFRTPSLLNVELTAPYGHNGGFQTLEQVIFHHTDTEASLESYDYQLNHLHQKNITTTHAKKWSEKALMVLKKQWAQGKSKLTVSKITKEEISAIKSFLTALTDPCLYDKSCLLPWVAYTHWISTSG